MTFKTGVVLTAFGILAGCSRGEDAHELASINRAALSPPNDRCSSSQTVVLNTPVNGTLVDANDDIGCSGSWGPDVFYTFTPSSSGTFRATVTAIDGGSSDGGPGFTPVLYLSDGVCLPPGDGGLGGWGCRSYGADHVNFRAAAATSQFVVVDTWSPTSVGPFTVEVRSFTPASNDTCAAPQPISLGVPVVANFDTAIDDDFSADAGYGCAQAPDLVYSFTAPTAGRYLLTTSNGAMSVTTGTCAMTCNNPVNSQLVDLAAGTTVFLIAQGSTQTTLRVDPVTPPANDLCPNAQPITAGTPVSGTTVGSLANACASSGDVFYRFTSPDGGTYRASVTDAGYVNAVSIGPGTCLGAFECNSASSTTFRLGAGQSSSLAVAIGYQQSPFVLRVDQVTPPVNDDCQTPTSLSLGVPAPISLGDAVDDLPGSPDAGSGSCGLRGLPDVHFRFVAPSAGRFRFTAPFMLSASQDSCAGTCLASRNYGTSDLSLASGAIVVMTVEGYPSSGAILVEQLIAPPNDLCVNAQALTVGVPASGTTLGATTDLVCSNTPEVFYRFAAPSSGTYVVRVAPLDGGAPYVGVTQGCGSDAGVPRDGGFVDAGTACLANYPPVRFTSTTGETHTISVSNWWESSFSIRVDAIVPPTNDSCASPTVLTPGVSVPVDLLGASDDIVDPFSDGGLGADAGAWCGTTGLPDLVFQVTASATGRYDFQGPGQLTASVGSCGTGCALSGWSFLSVPLQAGETAYVVLENSPLANGTMVVHYTVPPSNDRCQAPSPIALATPVNGTTRGATASFACGFNGGSPDVIYQFTPGVTAPYRATISTDGGWVTASWAEAHCDGGCLSDVDVYRGTSGVPAFLVVSSPYPLSGADFNVVVQQVIPPSNDACTNPTPLTLGQTASVAMVDAFDDYPRLSDAGVCTSDGGCGECGIYRAPDVVWSFTAPSEDDYVVMTNGFVSIGATCGICSQQVVGDVRVHLATGQTIYAITEPYFVGASVVQVERAGAYFDGGVRLDGGISGYLDAGWGAGGGFVGGGGSSGVGGGASGGGSAAGGAAGGAIGGGSSGGGSAGGQSGGGSAGGVGGGGSSGGGSAGGGGGGGSSGGGSAGGSSAGGSAGGGSAGGGTAVSGGSATAGGSVSGGGTGGGTTNEGCSGCSSSGAAIAFAALGLLTLRRRRRA